MNWNIHDLKFSLLLPGTAKLDFKVFHRFVSQPCARNKLLKRILARVFNRHAKSSSFVASLTTALFISLARSNDEVKHV